MCECTVLFARGLKVSTVDGEAQHLVTQPEVMMAVRSSKAGIEKPKQTSLQATVHQQMSCFRSD